MSNKRELPTPFIQEEFPMPEYKELRRRLWKEPDLEKYKDALKEYQGKAKEENLSSKKKFEYEKIIKFLDGSIKRKDPRSMLRTDEKYLREKYGTNYNV